MRARKLTAALAAVPVLLAGAIGAAHADNLKNDVASTAGGKAITIESGKTATVQYSIDNTSAGGGGYQVCDATAASPVTVSVNTPSGVTAQPSSLQFSSCDTWKPVTFSSSTPSPAAGYAITHGATDDFGNYNTNGADFTLHVTGGDSTPPEISYTLSPATPDGSEGWYRSDVTLTWNVTEDESPSSLQKTGCVDQQITADQAATTYTCAASSAGGDAAQKSVSIKRDATAPTDITFVGGPTGDFFYGSDPGKPTCEATDLLSGLDECVVTGGGSSVGTHSYVATATDLAGNVSTRTLTYEVKPWATKGFYAPVDLKGVVNTVKGGSTVPLKFEVFADTELTQTSVVKSFVQTKVQCGTSAILDEIEVTTTGGTSLRYDATSGQFVQNWQTPKAAGACYVATVTFQDGSKISADFQLK